MTKKDKREINSQNKIEDALLDFLNHSDLSDITIANICDKAHVSRTTFYKHYRNTYELFEKTVDKLIDETLDIGNEFFNCIMKKKNKGYPMCELIRTDSRYKAIMKNDELTAIFIEKISEKIDPEVIRTIAANNGLTSFQVKTLLQYQISGCVTAIRGHFDESSSEWKKHKKVIDDFLKRGYQFIE